MRIFPWRRSHWRHTSSVLGGGGGRGPGGEGLRLWPSSPAAPGGCSNLSNFCLALKSRTLPGWNKHLFMLSPLGYLRFTERSLWRFLWAETEHQQPSRPSLSRPERTETPAGRWSWWGGNQAHCRPGQDGPRPEIFLIRHCPVSLSYLWLRCCPYPGGSREGPPGPGREPGGSWVFPWGRGWRSRLCRWRWREPPVPPLAHWWPAQPTPPCPGWLWSPPGQSAGRRRRRWSRREEWSSFFPESWVISRREHSPLWPAEEGRRLWGQITDHVSEDFLTYPGYRLLVQRRTIGISWVAGGCWVQA